MLQIIGRLVRIGQKDAVFFHLLKVKETYQSDQLGAYNIKTEPTAVRCGQNIMVHGNATVCGNVRNWGKLLADADRCYDNCRDAQSEFSEVY